MQSKEALNAVPDDELLRRLVELLRHSRGTEADLVAHVGEVDARRLYAREASPSMYAYCTDVLHLSEAEAYLRIAVARASRAHPVLLEMLADGRLHLSAIAKLASHLTTENRQALLERATHKSKREVEELIAEIDPRPDVAASMRKLPERRIGALVSSAEVRLDGAARAPASPMPPNRPALFGGHLRPDSVVGGHLRPDQPSSARPELRPDQDSSAAPELRPDRVVSNGMGGTVSSGIERSSADVASADVGDRRFAGSSFRPALIEPLAQARYKVQFTASAELRDKLERLRALMRHSVPDGDLAAIIEAAVTEKLERLEARRFGRTKAPRKLLGSQDVSSPPDPAVPSEGDLASGEGAATSGKRSLSGQSRSPATRHVPAEVKRAVDERDGGQCRYTNAPGRRCTEREELEFHHRHPFGFGGGHSVEQISLVCRLCRARHNLHYADRRIMPTPPPRLVSTKVATRRRSA